MNNPTRLALAFAALLSLAACNDAGRNASANFNAAGQSIGNGHLGSAANETGQAFSSGANATGQAISNTAHNASQ